MPDFVSSSPFLVVTGVVILMLILAFVASRYKVAGANEAIIVAGSRGAKVHDDSRERTDGDEHPHNVELLHDQPPQDGHNKGMHRRSADLPKAPTASGRAIVYLEV